MFENLESLEKVRRKVLDLAARGWKVLNNCGSIEDTQAQLTEVLSEWDASS
jgi:thymidylate kinase